MSLTITPGSIVSDGHVVLLPTGATGTITTNDGTAYDLGPADQVAIEVGSHAHAKEVAFALSQGDDPDADAVSRKNLNLKKKG